MKKIILTLTAFALISSCADSDFDINADPDNPTEAELSTVLPAGIAGIAGAQGSFLAIAGGFWSQYWTQGNSSTQYIEFDDYSVGPVSDVATSWTAMYDALGDVRFVKRRAEAEGNWNYYLIATTLEVYGSQIMADFHDQIPYEQANDVNFLQPEFNTGPEVYDLMAADLQLALSRDLSASAGEVPGEEDFIFGGNMANWTAFANTLLLRVYMRQTEARPAVAQAGITALLTSGAPFLNVDAAMTQFEDAANRSNPLYETDRRQLNTQINLRMSTTMFSFLDANGDPRRAEYYEPGNSLNQGDFNSQIAQTSIAVVTLYPTTPVFFMSREESLLLQAEALERYAGGAGAKEKYDAAVIHNMGRYNGDDGNPTTTDDQNDGPVLDGTPFVAPGGAYEYPSAGTFEQKLEAIITQKWVSLFPGNGFEAFFEQNRTGYPEISPVPQTSPAYVPGQLAYSVNGTTGGDFPRRLVFPEDVTSRNENAPAVVELTEPVWWDVN